MLKKLKNYLEAIMLNAKEKQLLVEFFAFFGLSEAQVNLTESGETITITLNVDAQDTGRYIGRFATTLDSLQLIVSLMINNGQTERRHIVIDVGGYREERAGALQRLADDAAAEVEKTGLAHALPPLSATDRRQVHLLFQDHATLTTYSEGEGQDRRLVIAPKTA
jgi:spoIIIJ-associated protein